VIEKAKEGGKTPRYSVEDYRGFLDIVRGIWRRDACFPFCGARPLLLFHMLVYQSDLGKRFLSGPFWSKIFTSLTYPSIGYRRRMNGG